MGALNTRTIVFLAALSPTLAACSVPLQSTSSERAISLYRESLGPRGTLSLRRDDSRRSAKQAAPADSAPSALTVDEAISLAKNNSARLAALEAGSAASEAGIAAADRAKNPELRVSQLRLDQIIEGVPQIRTAIRYSPNRPGKVAADVAEARGAHAESEADRRAEELDIEADIRWLFDDVTLLDAEIAAARAVAQARRSLSNQMKSRLAASEALSVDDAMAELAAVESDADLAMQEARRKQAAGELLDRVGIAPDASVQIVGDPPLAWPPPALPSEQTLIEEALRRSPGVMAAASRIDAAEARAFAERGKRFPWFSFFEVGYEFGVNTATGLGWRFQAGVDLPIFDTNRAGVAASDSARKAAEHALAAEVEKVARDVRARLREVRAAEALVTEYRAKALPVAEHAGKETTRALEGRNIDVIRALSVEERRAVVQLRLLRLVRLHRSAMAELRRVSGNVNSAVTP